MIEISKVPTEYRKQVERFLLYYRNGQEIAFRYLNLVTNPKYRNEKKRGRPMAIANTTSRKPDAEKPSHRKRAIILGEIALNPGQSSQQIANKTGIPVASVRHFLAQMKREDLIEGFTENKAGYHLKRDSLC